MEIPFDVRNLITISSRNKNNQPLFCCWKEVKDWISSAIVETYSLKALTIVVGPVKVVLL